MHLQQIEENGAGLGQLKGHSEVVGLLHGVDVGQGVQKTRIVGILDAVKGIDHRVGGNRVPVGELGVLIQMDHIGEAVIRYLPALGQGRLNVTGVRHLVTLVVFLGSVGDQLIVSRVDELCGGGIRTLGGVQRLAALGVSQGQHLAARVCRIVRGRLGLSALLGRPALARSGGSRRGGVGIVCICVGSAARQGRCHHSGGQCRQKSFLHNLFSSISKICV